MLLWSLRIGQVTLDQVELIVPNSAITRDRVLNFSRPSPVSRRQVEVLCPYHVPTHRVQQVILSNLREVPGVVRDPAPQVFTQEFADSGVNYRIYFYLDDYALYPSIESDVRDRVWYALQRASIEIPFPIRTVRLLNGRFAFYRASGMPLSVFGCCETACGNRFLTTVNLRLPIP